MAIPVVVLLLCVLSPAESFWGISWLWNNSPSVKEASKVVGSLPVTNVPFEAKAEDEKFLEAARKYTDLQLSELDSCQHKIVLHIRSSCSDMTEEDLAKMSVNLLNCQSSVEGRQIFPCTESMSLRECTMNMDPDMWNTYHLMSNRARAVCYAARQQQFRALSEMTVNKLMHSAHDQLEAMEKLNDGQQKLASFTVGTMNSVAAGQESLLRQQETMKVTQQNLRDFVSFNLRELTKEKALIAAGHKELSKMTEDIKTKLDSASSQLVDLSSEQLVNHRTLLKDLEDIKEHANIIWREIELSTQEILAHHEAASLKYEDTLNKLSKINETVSFLLQLMEITHSQLNERLGWLSNVVGAAGIYVFAMHIAYLLVGMVASAFLQAPTLTRLCLLLIVPLNLSVIYHHGYDSALNYISMTTLIILSTVVHWLTTSILMYARKKKHASQLHQQSMMNGHAFIPSQTVIPSVSWWSAFREAVSQVTDNTKKWFSQLNESVRNRSLNRKKEKCLDEDSEGSDSDVSCSSSLRNEISYSSGLRRVRKSPTPVYQRLVSQNTYMSPPTPPKSFSRSGTPQNSSIRSSTPRPQCLALCRSGLPCRNSAVAGDNMCRIHIQDTQ